MLSAYTSVLSAMLLSTAVIAGFSAPQAAPASQNRFGNSTDIGTAQPGSSRFDAATGTYEVRGGGDDVWGAADAFRFTWTQFPGDGTLSADVQVAQPGTFPKAKGMLMFRGGLDPSAPYADIAEHADGHITLQYRLTQGGATKDVDLPEHGPARLQIAREGNTYTASVLSGGGSSSQPSSISVTLPGPAYVGLGVCSHSTTALQAVTFSNVKLASGK